MKRNQWSKKTREQKINVAIRDAARTVLMIIGRHKLKPGMLLPPDRDLDMVTVIAGWADLRECLEDIDPLPVLANMGGDLTGDPPPR
jgi:hypothetical protein